MGQPLRPPVECDQQGLAGVGPSQCGPQTDGRRVRGGGRGQRPVEVAPGPQLPRHLLEDPRELGPLEPPLARHHRVVEETAHGDGCHRPPNSDRTVSGPRTSAMSSTRRTSEPVRATCTITSTAEAI